MDVPPNGITPDYAKSLEEVYLDVVKFQLTQLGDELDFLGYIIRSSADFLNIKDTHEPLKASWIPDWRNKILNPPFSKAMELRDPISGVSSRTAIYRAGDGLPVNRSMDGLYLDVGAVRQT